MIVRMRMRVAGGGGGASDSRNAVARCVVWAVVNAKEEEEIFETAVA